MDWIEDESIRFSAPPLLDNAVKRKLSYQSSNALLAGLLYDDRGNRMIPSFARKRGARYRYHVSSPLLQSRKDEAGSVSRVTASEIEDAIIAVLRERKIVSGDDANITPELLKDIVERIELRENELQISLVDESVSKGGILSIPWQKTPSATPKGVLHSPATSGRRLSPETRNALLSAIARARKWIADIDSGAVQSLEEIAEQEGNGERHIRLLLPLAFTPPALISSILEGRAPHDLTVTGLAREVSMVWSIT